VSACTTETPGLNTATVSQAVVMNDATIVSRLVFFLLTMI
jgi:hypothetical protein